jgi:diacylglycerol kinase (ATP)
MQSENSSDSSESAQLYAIIIVNPASRRFLFHPHHFNETIAFLRQHNWRVDLWYTHMPGDGVQLARKAVAQKANMVIAAGGDGTINDIIQGLAGTETVLGVLPNGTTNVWARELGIPLDDAGAREILVNGQIRRVDLGCVNDRYFLLMVGIGLDGEVTQAVERKPLKRLGVVGYALAAIWLGPGYSGFPVVVQIDGYVVKTRALQIIVGNTQLYAGALKFTWKAQCDDGLLDLCIVHKRNLWGRLVVLWDFFMRREQRHLWVRYETIRSIKIETPQPVAFQIDGEAAGHTPAVFTVAPLALKVVVPPKTSEGLFSREVNGTQDTSIIETT